MSVSSGFITCIMQYLPNPLLGVYLHYHRLYEFLEMLCELCEQLRVTVAGDSNEHRGNCAEADCSRT